MGTWTSVVDVTENMQLVDGQPLDYITDGADEIIGTACRNDGVNNHTDIGRLVDVGKALVEQFLNDI